MEIKEKIYNFPIENIYHSKSDQADNDIKIDAFLSDVEKKLENIKLDFENLLTTEVKLSLVELCKIVKKKISHDDQEEFFK